MKKCEKDENRRKICVGNEWKEENTEKKQKKKSFAKGNLRKKLVVKGVTLFWELDWSSRNERQKFIRITDTAQR